MEETLLGKLLHALVFLLICAAIIAIGWNEPLRYRFMSPQQIADAEFEAHPPPPPPPSTPGPVDFENWRSTSGLRGTALRGAALDRAPWDKKKNQVEYHPGNLDSKGMGPPTETDRRTNTIGKH